MGNYNYVISQLAHQKIYSFYTNVAKKYGNTYSFELMQKNIEDALRSINSIENGLIRRKPTISLWSGYFMATSPNHKWNYAYRIDGDTIYVEDACHSQNMHESIGHKRLKQFIKECVRDALRRY